MADDLCIFGKDSLIVKSPKKNPLALRMVVLIFVMVCGVYICSVCLRQVGGRSTGRLLSVEVAERPCEVTNIEPSDKRYVHFPKPKTFSSCGCVFVQLMKTEYLTHVFPQKPRLLVLGFIFFVLLDEKKFSFHYNVKGLMQHHDEIVEYFKSKGVSAIFLFRRNLLRRMVSILANSYDQNAKLINGTHKSHVHSTHEAEVLASYKPSINTTLLIPNLRQVEDLVTRSLQYFNSTRHIILYYEDVIKNRTRLVDVQDFLRVPRQELKSRQVKIHKGLLSSQVENWDDVRKTLKGTHYESFLNEDYKL
ncbi:hypothetical protein CDL12_06855 [Handroanthus impetiginosus]|uniref:Sulfotransferase n=1 Tax=Handroanthus impetiginosus TaxID=429701 RepID=A0A2G9HSF5_9LAMI|nr:hypothetical protein CDL12_06855 [Handroanthus impetiginosus]